MSSTVQLHIKGMDCPDEIEDLRRAFARQTGILELSFNLMRSTMTVAFDPSSASPERISSIVESTGMHAMPLRDAALPAQEADQGQRRALAMTIVAGAGTAIGLALTSAPATSFHNTTWPAAVAYSIAIIAAWWHIAPKAWRATGRFQLDMNVLMTVAVAGALVLGEWFEASTVAFLFMLSNWLESWSVGRARRAIQSLMELAPPTARVQKENGLEFEIDANDVSIGDRVIVKPGEKFPLDGHVVEGSTSANQAPITGESTPVNKTIGDEVFAGTINRNSSATCNGCNRSAVCNVAGEVK